MDAMTNNDAETLAEAAEAEVWALADELCTTWHSNDGEVIGETPGLSGHLTSRWACQDCYDIACTLVDTKWLGVERQRVLTDLADEMDVTWNRGHDRSVHPYSHLARECAARIAQGRA